MKKEQIIPFEEKKVKLVQYPNFVLSGIIDEVFDDCIIFEDSKMRRVIDTSIIVEVSKPRF